MNMVDQGESLEDMSRLSHVMRKYNTSLERIRCYNATFDETESEENKAIQFYARLNRLGRYKTRLDSFSRADLVEILVNVHSTEVGCTLLGCTFGILIECPATWSSNNNKPRIGEKNL